ncbi:MAG TPA: hypothetical protein VMB77_01900 [Syntrophales bacterium]|nr:hypothetical protein [Syntrophales bacterium]
MRFPLTFFLSFFFVMAFGDGALPGDLKTIIDLQPFRQESSIPIKGAAGEEGRANLIQLNSHVNDWYVLRLSWGSGAATAEYHLENARPGSQKLLLDERHPQGLVIEERKKKSNCDLWGTNSKESLAAARATHAAYASLCGGKLYLRNPVKGHRTQIESVTDFLRDGVPAGEKIVSTVKDNFYQDAFREEAQTVEESKPSSPGPIRRKLGAPGPARIDPSRAGQVIASSHLGIEVRDLPAQRIIPGNWYEAAGNPGIYVSLIAPHLIAQDILRSDPRVVGTLDRVESEALVYLVAFDLDQFGVRFSLGTEHPRVDWSDRVQDRMKDPSLPGPDGIGTIAPLVSNGLVSPTDVGRTAAVFTGGFKRTHGAFRWGQLALQNHGSHYGFIEHGTVFSKLQPGLATLYELQDGRLGMKTWSEEDTPLLSQIRSARQNGVPIITGYRREARLPEPGPLVSRWGEGNWSGSEEKKLRTMRAGVALQEVKGKRFLLYAVFTSATPSAMARVFQAYGCLYAMHLDMNALEHTYLAVYQRQGSNLVIQHPIQGMSALDKSSKGQYVPRFLGYADNRDFFTVLRKEAQ